MTLKHFFTIKIVPVVINWGVLENWKSTAPVL